MNRLTGMSTQVASYNYTLGPTGNRTSETSSLPGISSGSWPVYNADDQQIPSESYDLNGNVTRTANGNSYTYDSQNHMMTASGNGKSISMIYDAFGNRVAKTVSGVTTQYLVEDDVNPTGYPQVIEELSGPIGAGVITRTYTYGLQRISENLSPALTGSNVWTPSFYVYDGAGSVRQLTNSAGVVTDEYEYDAYGNSFTKQGTTPNNYLYRGEQYDSDLGLYYLRARYYNPATGTFMSRDPEDGYIDDPASLHKYLYANGEPENGFDPTGRGDIITLQLRYYLALNAVTVFAQTMFQGAVYWGQLWATWVPMIATNPMALFEIVEDIPRVGPFIKPFACAATGVLLSEVVLDAAGVKDRNWRRFIESISSMLGDFCGNGFAP